MVKFINPERIARCPGDLMHKGNGLYSWQPRFQENDRDPLGESTVYAQVEAHQALTVADPAHPATLHTQPELTALTQKNGPTKPLKTPGRTMTLTPAICQSQSPDQLKGNTAVWEGSVCG